MLKGCGQAVCRKKGSKAVWEVCPNPATKEDMQRVEDSLSTLKGTDENILASLKVLEKKLENICDAFNITPAPTTTGVCNFTLDFTSSEKFGTLFPIC